MHKTLDIKWIDLPDGRRLLGDENGLGCIVDPAAETADGASEIAFAGELKGGVLNGYGFVFRKKVTEETYTRRPTYEEVMSTAEFDSCGRVIYCDGSMRTEVRRNVEWIKEGIGLWKDGRLVELSKMVFPEGLVLTAKWDEYTYEKLNYEYMPEDMPLSGANEDGVLEKGWYKACVQPLPDGRIMVLEGHGAVAILAPGDSFTFEHDKNPTCYNTYTYTLTDANLSR